MDENNQGQQNQNNAFGQNPESASMPSITPEDDNQHRAMPGQEFITGQPDTVVQQPNNYNQPQSNVQRSTDGFINPMPAQQPLQMNNSQPNDPPANNFDNPLDQQAAFDPQQTKLSAPTASGSPNKSKLPLIIIAILLILTGVGLLVYLNFIASPVAKNQTAAPAAPIVESGKKEKYVAVLDKIEKELNIKDVNKESQEDLQKTMKQDFSLPVYFSFDDSKDYSQTKADDFRRYQLPAGEFAKSADEPKCDAFSQKYKSQLIKIEDLFKQAGYKVQPNRFYTQYENCGNDRIVAGAHDVCSISFGLDSDTTGKLKDAQGMRQGVVGVNIACLANKNLEKDINKAKQGKEVFDGLQKDLIGSEQKLGRLIYPAEYVRDSKTPGYKIAKLANIQGDSFYYKKEAGKWTYVDTDPSGIECAKVQKNNELKLAFKGEECLDAKSQSKKIIE